jgi:hypothetical protein
MKKDGDIPCYNCPNKATGKFVYSKHFFGAFCTDECMEKWERVILSRAKYDTQGCDAHLISASPSLGDATQGIACELPLHDAGYTVTPVAATRCLFNLVPGRVLHGHADLRVPRPTPQLWFADDCEYMHDFDFKIRFHAPALGIATVISLHTIDGVSVHATMDQLVAVIGLMYKWNAMLDEPPKINSMIAALTDAWKRRRFDLVARQSSSQGVWIYRQDELLLCHIIMFSAELLPIISERLSEILKVDGAVDLLIASYRDYIQQKLSLLAPGRFSVPTTTQHERGAVYFSTAPLDDPIWPFLVDAYKNENRDGTFSVNDLLDPRFVSFVARSVETGMLLGYVVCTLEPKKLGQRLEKKHQWWLTRHSMLKYFLRDPVGHYSTLSINGLHVTHDWRGGTTNSLATLLIFHALHFAQAISEETGVMRVSCYSKARTTAIIMRQFGAVHLDTKVAFSWIVERHDAGRSVGREILDFVTDYVPSDTNNKPENAGHMAWYPADKQQADLIKTLRNVILTRTQPEWVTAPLTTVQKVANSHDDTFLYIGPENTVFHEMLNAYRSRFKDHAIEISGGDGPVQKRSKTGTLALPMATLDAFTVHVD